MLNNIGKFISIGIAASFLLGLSSSMSAAGGQNHTSAEAMAFSPHDPIRIESDLDFTADNGVIRGSGTPSDPFVIGGWDINASSATGIYVADTTASFVIERVYVHDGLAGQHRGMELRDNDRFEVRSSIVTRNAWGIICSGATEGWIHGNVVTDNFGEGIWALGGGTVRVTDNSLDRNSYAGIYLNVEDSVVAYNHLEGNGDGVSALYASNLTIVGNEVSNNVGRGISVETSGSVLIQNNRVREGHSVGVSVHDSSSVLVKDNLIEKASSGIAVQWSDDVHIKENTIQSCDVGVSIEYGIGCHVFHNNFVDNSYSAIEVFDIFLGGSIWDAGYPSGGNYWSDYGGGDNYSGLLQDVFGPDGLGDTPYKFNSSLWGTALMDRFDQYPLMTPKETNSAPTVNLTASPSEGPTSVMYLFSAEDCADDEDLAEWLLVRWDCDGDGEWDTPWSFDKTRAIEFTEARNHTVRVEIMDSEGLTSRAEIVVSVSEEDIPEFSGPAAVLIGLIALLFVMIRRRRVI